MEVPLPACPASPHETGWLVPLGIKRLVDDCAQLLDREIGLRLADAEQMRNNFLQG